MALRPGLPESPRGADFKDVEVHVPREIFIANSEVLIEGQDVSGQQVRDDELEFVERIDGNKRFHARPDLRAVRQCREKLIKLGLQMLHGCLLEE